MLDRTDDHFRGHTTIKVMSLQTSHRWLDLKDEEVWSFPTIMTGMIRDLESNVLSLTPRFMVDTRILRIYLQRSVCKQPLRMNCKDTPITPSLSPQVVYRVVDGV